jgi:hypothetical protein
VTAPASNDIFACPRCHGALIEAPEALLCPKCGGAYPVVSGIPCLLEDPTLWRGLWKARLDDYLANIDQRLEALSSEMNGPNLLAATQKRLRSVHDAVASDRRVFVELFRELVPSSATGRRLLPGGDPRAGDTAAIEYAEHVFRDFVWGGNETAAALDIVRRLSPGSLAKTAILGVATGRLALDVQRELRAERTVGFDIHPFPLLVRSRLFSGEELELHEYPLAPHSSADVAVRHRLGRPFPKPENVFFTFADALSPPLVPGSVDSVITPWFIDAVAADVRETAAAVNHVLRPGGVWLNFGPLRFQGGLARLYSIDEVHELVASSGFELGTRFSEDVPYFHSPHSGFHRTERVFAFAATKRSEAPSVGTRSLYAPWLSDTTLPIPIGSAFARLQRTSILTVGILSMIDGKRSIADIAAALGQQWGVPAEVLTRELGPFLARLPFD